MLGGLLSTALWEGSSGPMGQAVTQQPGRWAPVGPRLACWEGEG